MTTNSRTSGDTLALMSRGVIALISLLLSGKIIKCFGSLKALSIAASLATGGLGLMSTGPFGPLPFMMGLYVLMSSFFGAVAYIQFIAARVRPGSMGAIHGGLSTFASLGFIIGSVAFTALFAVLKEEQRWLCFLVGCFISAAGCVSIITIPGAPGKEVEPQNGNGKNLQRKYNSTSMRVKNHQQGKKKFAGKQFSKKKLTPLLFTELDENVHAMRIPMWLSTSFYTHKLY